MYKNILMGMILIVLVMPNIVKSIAEYKVEDADIDSNENTAAHKSFLRAGGGLTVPNNPNNPNFVPWDGADQSPDLG